MLSQQESWVFPIFHSSQDVSPQGRRNRSTTPSSCFAQFPAECQAISWPYQHTSGKTSTAHPSLCPGSTEIPKSLFSCPTQLRAGIFLHFISFSKISYRKIYRFHLKHQLNEKYLILEEKVKIFISERPRRGDGTRTAHIPTETITSWELGAKGSAGKNLPLRNILLIQLIKRL